ncbi:unnamed protein product [Lepidochelys kempii]
MAGSRDNPSHTPPPAPPWGGSCPAPWNDDAPWPEGMCCGTGRTKRRWERGMVEQLRSRWPPRPRAAGRPAGCGGHTPPAWLAAEPPAASGPLLQADMGGALFFRRRWDPAAGSCTSPEPGVGWGSSHSRPFYCPPNRPARPSRAAAAARVRVRPANAPTRPQTRGEEHEAEQNKLNENAMGVGGDCCGTPPPVSPFS